MVLKRIEVPRAEYHYDKAIELIIEVNEIYNPSWIYCDAGGGEYQVERLHIYGDEHPETGLKHKVVRRNFKQSLEITDPITHEIEKKPLKLFMVNQLQVAFERDLMILSPFDETLHKQLIDYEVVKFTGLTNDPVFTNVNEHFVDALGLAYLAFVLEFNELIDMVRDTSVTTVLSAMSTSFAKKSVQSLIAKTEQPFVANGYADPFQDEGLFSQKLIKEPVYSSVYSKRQQWNGQRRVANRRSSGRTSW